MTADPAKLRTLAAIASEEAVAVLEDAFERARRGEFREVYVVAKLGSGEYRIKGSSREDTVAAVGALEYLKHTLLR